MEISKIIIGAMRLKDRTSAVSVIQAAIDAGFNYIDTSPAYCYKTEKENSETWIGEALRQGDYRSRVLVSTKCSPGDGGYGLGSFNPKKGFGVRTIKQVQQVLEQSLNRLMFNHLDYYHLWTTHTGEQFKEALKPGGWYDGIMSQKHRWDHLGLTTHADSKTIVEFLESGRFETLTMPLNVINTTRLDVLEYCGKKGIKVIAMNPLAGGFLATQEELKELALRYLMRLENVHLLIGFSSVEEVKYARWIVDSMPQYKAKIPEILQKVNKLINAAEPRCTACGYCQACPQKINVGAALSYYNIYKYMGLKEAKKSFQDKQWEDGLRLDRCQACGICESLCPNKLAVIAIIRDAQKMLYDTPINT